MFVTDGQFQLTKRIIRQYMGLFNIQSKSTLTNHLNWLIDSGWIEHNAKTRSYRLLELTNISVKIDTQQCTGAIIQFKDLMTFREYIYAAIIAFESKKAGWRRKLPMKDEKVSHMKGYKKPGTVKYKDHFALANSYLAKILDVNSVTLSYLQRLSRRAGYISVHPHFIKVKNAIYNELELFRKYGADGDSAVTYNEGSICIQKPNFIRSIIKLKDLK